MEFPNQKLTADEHMNYPPDSTKTKTKARTNNMREITTKVKNVKRQTMVKFLTEHFRYDTAGSWNAANSYAAKMKIYTFVPNDLQDNAFALLDQGDVLEVINDVIRDWEAEHNYRWQAGFNGRSGGYLVLYQGEAKPSEYKSHCTKCGQKNFTSVKENSTKCGMCGANARIDYKTPPLQISVFPGKGVDMNEDFQEWDLEDIKARYELVKSFDALAETCKAIFIDYCKGYTVEEETITVEKKVKVLKENEA